MLDTESNPCNSGRVRRAKSPTLYAELRSDLEAAGCFDQSPLHYAARATLCVAAISVGYLIAWSAGNWPMFLVGSLLAAIGTVQAAFVAHEIGDGALTRNRRVSEWINQFVMTFMTGTSSSYFDHVHHLHHQVVLKRPPAGKAAHLVQNRYEFRSIKRLFAGNGAVFAAAMLLLRGILFRLESLRFLAANPRHTRSDAATLFLHYVVFMAAPALIFGPGTAVLNYGAVALVAGPYIGFVLVINHEGMSRAELVQNTDKVERVLKTTRNLPASRLNDILLGGVNNHIEHHLFPDLPAAHLPRARRIVEAHLKGRGKPYKVVTVRSAATSSLRHFRNLRRDELEVAAIA